jgi:hypothetical protein
MVHYEVVWPDGSLLRIFPTHDTALRCAQVWWERGCACRIRKRVGSVAPSALTMAAAVKKLRRGGDDGV